MKELHTRMAKEVSINLAKKPLAIIASLLLCACQTITAPAPMVAQDADQNAPTPLAELFAATILDVDLYRPSAQLAGCTLRAIPRAQPDPRMITAIAAAEAYSRQMGGLSFAVLHNGALIHESYSPGMDANTPTVSASMAKSVLGLVTGIALEDGLVASLDDRVSLYIPEWRGDPRGEIQLKHLLTMSSGLGSYDGEKFLLARDSTSVLLETPLADPAGVHFAYSNAVSQTLAIVLDRQARAHGYAGYADYLQKKLWCPLGNADAELWVDPLGMPRAYAGLHTGLHDWARIGELIRTKGRVGERQIVPASWITEMTSPSPLNPQYGYQIWLGREWTEKRMYSRNSTVGVPHSEPFLAPEIVYFDGFGGQRVYVLPSQGLTIVRTGMTNIEFDDAIIPNLLVRAMQ